MEKNFNRIVLLIFGILISQISQAQQPDSTVNLALLPDATLSGSVISGRGTPEAILYNPSVGDYHVSTSYNEYGIPKNDNLGLVDATNGFEWKVEWSSAKNINYITFGGVYPNQPQPNTAWRISYLSGTTWNIIQEGIGGWIDSGIFEWDNTQGQPVLADAVRIQIFSDGANDLVSIHLRGRGGISQNINDSATTPKACLIQLLPYNNSQPSSLWDVSGTDLYYNTGNIGIGTNDPGSDKLAVNGNIRAKEVKVEIANWPDYVFDKEYHLLSLEEIQKHINEKGHLPNIPSAREIEANGLDLGEMNRLLLEKIEELTLHLMRQEKRIQLLEKN